jgi:conserved repeat domain/conserved repeat domain
MRMILLASVTLALAMIFIYPMIKAPRSVMASPYSSGPNPYATLSVPDEVLIGETFSFNVTFDNTSTNPTDEGYGPFIDLILPERGADGNLPSHACDGITFVSAQMVGVNGGPLPVTTYPTMYTACNLSTSPCAPLSMPHPYAGSGVATFNIPSGYQLTTIELPFGSFQPSQPPIIIQVTAQVSNLADANTALDIYVRGGFRFGALPNNGPPIFHTPPPLSIMNCIDWDDKKSVAPVVFTFLTEDPLSPTPGPCFDGTDNGGDGVIDADDPDCKRAKTYIGPEDETATGPNFPRQYKIILNIAKGQTLTNLTVQDCLPNNAVFISSTFPAVQVANNCFNFNFPSIMGGPTATDIVILINFYIPENANGNPVLDSATCANATSPNDVKATGLWQPLDLSDPQQTVTSDASSVDHLLTDKHLALQKSVKVYVSPVGPLPGNILQYTLDFQVSDYFTMGNLEIADTLLDGQSLSQTMPATLTVKDGFGTSTGNFTISPNSNPTLVQTADPTATCDSLAGTVGPVTGGTQLTFKISTALSQFGSNPRHLAGILTGGHAGSPSLTTPATGQIVFYAKIEDTFAYPHPGDKYVDKHDPIINCAIIRGELFKNVSSPTIPQTTGVKCDDDSHTNISILGGVLQKKIVCKNGTPISSLSTPQFAAGDTITFQIFMILPSGDTENLKFTDWLPKPVLPVGSLNGTIIPGPACPTSGQIVLGPQDTLHTLGLGNPTVIPDMMANTLTITYPPSLNNPANTFKVIDIRFTLTVSAAPYADGLLFNNEVQECEDNTFGKTFCQIAVAPFKLTEPSLKITKGVVWTGNPNQNASAVFTPPQVAPSGVTFLGPGSSCPRFNGTITSTKLNTTPINSDLSNVDANDVVTFAITVENTGTGLHGAFDVGIKDVLPGCVTLISPICVTYGDGTPIGYTGTLFGGGIVLNDSTGAGALAPFPNSTGHNIAVITFDVKIKSNVNPGCCLNRTDLTSYAAAEQGPNFVPAGFGGPFMDTAQVCILPAAEKCIRATSELHTAPGTTCLAAPNPVPVAIGEIMRYRLKVTLPEGVSPNFQLQDSLPVGVSYLGNLAVVFVSDNGITSSGLHAMSGAGLNLPGKLAACCGRPGTSFAPPLGNTTVSGQTVTFSLGTLTNSDNDPDSEFVLLDFNALVQNIPANQDGVNLNNNFQVLVSNSPLVTSNTVGAVIREPHIIVNKTVSPNPAQPGATATFTITLTNGTATAFDVAMIDALPASLLYVNGSGAVTTSSANCSTPVLTQGNPVKVNMAQFPVGCTVVVTFQALIRSTCPAQIPNTANVTYTSLPNLGTPPNSIGNATGSMTPGLTGALNGEEAYTASGSVILGVQCQSACAPRPNGMVAWWPLDEANGATIIQDIQPPNYNNGAPKPGPGVGAANSPSSINGMVQGAHFFLTPSYHEFPNHSRLNFGPGSFSIDAWVRLPSRNSPTIQSFVDKLSPPPGLQTGYAFYARHSGGTTDIVSLELVIANGTTVMTYVCTQPLAVNAWTHVAVTVDRSTVSGKVTFYVDGNPYQATGLSLAGNITNNVVLWMGRSRLNIPPGLSDPFELRLDEVELFKTVITPAEVQAIYAAKSLGKCRP